MKITKLGHCCLLIETKGKHILTDPGKFTAESHVLNQIDVVLITHEHTDHVHVDSLQDIVAKNPGVQVVTNSAVGKLLTEAGIAHETLEGSAAAEYAGVAIQAHDAKHAEIFETFGQVQNTGYFIDERLFYPGDAYPDFSKPIEILAMPSGGPWCRTTDTLHFALKIKPVHAFPVHDGIEREDRVDIIHGVLKTVLAEHGITFTPLKANDSIEF